MIRFRFRIATLALALLAVVALSDIAAAKPIRVGPLQAELVSAVQTIQPGQPFMVALRLVPDDHWHVYWRNPGDSGLPPKVRWELPEGFSAGEIQWPIPGRIVLAPLTSFGYSGEVLLPIQIVPPDEFDRSSPVNLKAHVSWLVCKEECLPGSADFVVELPVSDNAARPNVLWGKGIDEAQELLPRADSDWKVSSSILDESIILNLTKPASFSGELDSILFFPYKKNLIAHSSPQKLSVTDDGYRIEIARSSYLLEKPDSISGILVLENGWGDGDSSTAIEFSAQVGEKVPPIPAAAASVSGLGKALLFAFLGGLILNLMPCVLPVLSLKILGFVKQANDGHGRVLSHGLLFTVGVLVSFWLLAGILLALKAGGQQLGWGFQLQSPGFVLLLASFMFLFGLNLLGVFEIGISLTASGGRLATRGGLTGSFLNGVLATAVATPCTAPFMGSALGFSLSQPGWVAMLIFTFLGLGMATPYVVLSASPALLRLVPKPGAWMESLKHVMGFLLMATVIWLAWVLGVQAGSNAVATLLVTLLLLGIGAWVYGRWGRYGARRRMVASSIAALVVVVALGLGIAGVRLTAAPVASTGNQRTGSIVWQPFSPDLVKELRAQGRPVFIDFTAAWCLSCQVNEQVAFSSEAVQERFADLNIAAVKADWTARDESITQALARFDRNSVPLYVLYGFESNKEPTILPEILTPGIVLDALAEVENGRDLAAHLSRTLIEQ